MKLVLLVLTLCTAAFADITQDPDYIEIHGNGVYTVSQANEANARAEKIRLEIERGGIERLAEKTNTALDAIYRVGIQNLRRRGYKAEALQLQKDWEFVNGWLIRAVRSRDIGDFAPISTKLAIAYEILELKLGYKICYALRLTDIKTLNYAIPVVFRPCPHGFQEFEKHFVHDDRYRGLLPVVAYWSSVIGCSFATFGAGYFFVCGPIAVAIEWGVDRAVAPWLAPKIYRAFCD